MPSTPIDLLTSVPFLIECFGFTAAKAEVEDSFGNMSITLTNGTLNVTVVRDRGVVDIDVSPAAAPEKRLPLSYLRQVALQLDLTDDVTLSQQADFLQSHYPAIADMLSLENWDNTNERVMKLGRTRWRRLFPGSIRE